MKLSQRREKQKLPAIKNELQHIQVNLHLHKNFFLFNIGRTWHSSVPLLHISTPKCFSSLIMSNNKKYGKRRSYVIIPAYLIEQNRAKIQSNPIKHQSFDWVR